MLWSGILVPIRISLVAALVGIPLTDSTELTPDEAAGIYQLLRDAQAQNASVMSQGTMSGVYERRQSGVPPATLTFGVSWDGERAFWKYRLDDPTQIFNIHQAGPPPMDWSYFYRDRETVYFYDRGMNTLRIDTVKDFGVPSVLDEVLPPTAWFSASPPNTAHGRPWVEMIGMPAFMPPSQVKAVVLAREANGDYLQRRMDQNGGEVRIRFSMAHGGNVRSSQYIPAPGRPPQQGEYHWRSDGNGRITPLGYEFTRGMKDQEDEIRVSLAVDSYSTDRPNLSINSILSLIPVNAQIDDRTPRNRTRPKSLLPQQEELYDILAETIRSRGFLKDNPR